MQGQNKAPESRLWVWAGHGSHLSPDAAALKKPGWHSANTKYICISSWTRTIVTPGKHPIWYNAEPVHPDHSRLFERSVLLWTFHLMCKSARLNGHVIVSRLKVRFGQMTEIWKRKQKQGSAQCWPIKTLLIPAKTLLTWSKPWNKNADSLPSRHSYSLLFQPPTPPCCCFLAVSLPTNTTSHPTFHNSKSVFNATIRQK